MFDCLKSEMTSTQAVSEALFDNCEDYQNIQNSSCKVKILLDVNHHHPTITITINITITMTITIPPQSQSPLTCHLQPKLSNSSPGSVAVAALLTCIVTWTDQQKI